MNVEDYGWSMHIFSDEFDIITILPPDIKFGDLQQYSSYMIRFNGEYKMLFELGNHDVLEMVNLSASYIENFSGTDVRLSTGSRAYEAPFNFHCEEPIIDKLPRMLEFLTK